MEPDSLEGWRSELQGVTIIPDLAGFGIEGWRSELLGAMANPYLAEFGTEVLTSLPN